MAEWICPDCGRLFGKAKQSHACSPGMSVDEYFSTGPPWERPIYERVMAHVSTLGPVHADAVQVGIFLKNPKKFAELRPMTKWVAISFGLSRRASHPTITRKVNDYNGMYWHVCNVKDASEVDDALLELLTEAYERHAS
jgi:hypothetical protein